MGEGLKISNARKVEKFMVEVALRIQVPDNHLHTPNLYYNYHYPKPKYLIIGYVDTLG